MLDYIDGEVAELIVSDIVDFYETYIAMKSLTMAEFDVRNKDDKTIEIYTHRDTNWKGESWPSAKIHRVSRTRVSFTFIFNKDEIEWALKLYHMLDGYIYVDLKNTTNVTVYFTMDLGSKQGCLDYFKNLQS